MSQDYCTCEKEHIEETERLGLMNLMQEMKEKSNKEGERNKENRKEGTKELMQKRDGITSHVCTIRTCVPVGKITHISISQLASLSEWNPRTVREWKKTDFFSYY